MKVCARRRMAPTTFGAVCLSERVTYEYAEAGATGLPVESARQLEFAVW